MIRIKSERVLLVAPGVFSVEVLASNKQIRQVSSAGSVFPAIFEMNPNLIVFDYDFMGKDLEQILRRIRSNNYYDKIKICCYKAKPHTKTDGLLKALGANYIIYKDEVAKADARSVNPLRNMVESTVMNLLVGPSY